jgi:hypothetical protein
VRYEIWDIRYEGNRAWSFFRFPSLEGPGVGFRERETLKFSIIKKSSQEIQK